MFKGKPEASADALLDFLRTQGRAAKVELSTGFDLPLAELDKLINALAAQGKIQFVPAGNGGFWELRSEGLVCDARTGVCTTGGF